MSKRPRTDDDCYIQSSAPTEAAIDYGPPSKYHHLSEAERKHDGEDLYHCSQAPHKGMYHFTTLEEYERHLKEHHSHQCCDCNQSFPSAHYLNLHISEYHDPIMEGKRAKGEKTYGCMVEGCERLCSTPQKRRLHAIDKHHFPKDYNFWVIKDGAFNKPKPREETATNAVLDHSRDNAMSVEKSGPDDQVAGDAMLTSMKPEEDNVDVTDASDRATASHGSGKVGETGREDDQRSSHAGGVDDLLEPFKGMKIERPKRGIKFGRGGAPMFRR